MLKLDYNIVLGSKSPRRVELLNGLDINFTSRVVETDEIYPSDMNPEDVPEYLAKEKAIAQENQMGSDDLLITADTIVIIDGEILEKPGNRSEAIEMVTKLSGKTHVVVTGVSIRTNDSWVTFSDKTEVTFTKLSNEEVEYYIDKYSPFDKAGSYGVQEWIGYIGIEKMVGSYYNVMGLPVQKLYNQLKAFSR